MIQSVKPAGNLEGTIELPADKSIAQRAAIFSLLHEDVSEIDNYPDAQDPQTALKCIEQLGAELSVSGNRIRVQGTGRDGIRAPDSWLDCGNSGTVMRLLAGIVAGAGCTCVLSGDRSLSRRPMKRIIDPLMQMGASIQAKNDEFPPLRIRRTEPIRPLSYRLPVASAQLKSCLLLAGLFGELPTVITEPVSCRNHTELMLGLPVHRHGSIRQITSSRNLPVPAQNLTIPGDFSAASFWLVAGSIVESSQIFMPGTGLNPSRIEALNILKKMGADIEVSHLSRTGGEPVADLLVRSAPLRAVRIEPEDVPNAIDELPVIGVAMAFAEGVSEISGAGELRFKESDRIEAMQRIFSKAGVSAEIREDGWTIYGKPGKCVNAARHNSYGDHRIAMSAAILSLRADGMSEIMGAEATGVSYPSFWDHLDILSGNTT